MAQPKHLFLSFNSTDREKVREVHQFLSYRGVSTFFDEISLRAGENWPSALESALEESSAVAVFIGAQMGSWQWPEIGFALDRQTKQKDFPVIPVLLDGADIRRSFLFLNTWIDLRGDRFTDTGVRERLIDALTGTGVSVSEPLDLNPYRGLKIFDEEHEPFFFGRETVIADLFNRLTVQRKTFVAVVGASGSGKSSVVRAGLIPKLRRRRPPNETWDVAVFKPGERPWFSVARAFAPLRFPSKSGTELDIEIDTMGKALQAGQLSLTSLIERVLQPQGLGHRLLLVIDQFEELFTLTQASVRTEFIDQLIASSTTHGLVLVPTLRADFYGQAIEAHRRLSELFGQEQVALGNLSPEELSRAILEPACLMRLQFDLGLPELILRDAGREPGHLPLLQHALLELYVRGRHTRRLTMEAYEAVGGIRRAIANSAEREFSRFERLGQGAVVRQLFTRLVRLARADEGVEDTRRRVTTLDLPAEAKRIIDEFAGAELRLLVKASERLTPTPDATYVGEHETVEVAHEALIREWDRLRGWLNEDRGFYLWRQRLDQALEEYTRQGAPVDYLLQGPALKEAEGKLAASMPEPLSKQHRLFIQASLDERYRLAREQQQAEEQRRREREELQQRERQALQSAAQAADEAARAAGEARDAETLRRRAAERAKRTSWGAALVLFVVAAMAVAQTWVAERQRRSATAQALTTQVGTLGVEKRSIALLLTALGLDFQVTKEARSTAIAMLMGEFRSRPLRGHESVVSSVAFSADGKRLVSGSWDKTLRLWDASTGRPLGEPLRGHEAYVTSVAFSPDGKHLVSGSEDGTLRIWHAGTGEPLGNPLRGHEGGVTSVVFSPDGKRLASGGEDGTLRLWDASTGRPLREPLRGHEGVVSSVAFSLPGGKRLVSGGEDRTLRLWDASTGEPLGQLLRGHESDVVSVAFSPDGERLVSGSDDKTLRLWDASTGEPLGEPLRGHESYVSSVAFSPDGKRLVSGSQDETLRLWNAVTGEPLGEPLRGHEGVVSSVAFSLDGKRLVSGSADNTLRLWNATTGAPLGEPLWGHKDRIASVAFSPDGKRLVSGGGDTLRLWDAGTGRPLGEYKDSVTSVTFSSDGKRFVSGSWDTTLRLRDANTGEPLGEPLRGHESYVASVAFSPDGKRLVSGSEDKTLRLWDATTGEPLGQPLRGHEDRVSSVAFSPDGKRLVSGSGDTLRLWDVSIGEPIGKPHAHEGRVFSVAFSPDGKRFVSGSGDKALRLWDAGTGKPLGESLRGHDGIVFSVAFSPDGKHLVSGSGDKVLRLWDANTGEPLGELRGHVGVVSSVAFSPSGKRLVSGSWDKTLRLWDMTLIASGKKLRDLLCQTSHRNLTRAEWRQYVPEGEEYRAVCENLPIEK